MAVREMTAPAKRERAALDVLALLPAWWAVGPTSYDPETITGTGEDELAAMIDLRIRLDERQGSCRCLPLRVNVVNRAPIASRPS